MDEWMAECRELAAEVVTHLTQTGRLLSLEEPEEGTGRISLEELERLRQESAAQPP